VSKVTRALIPFLLLLTALAVAACGGGGGGGSSASGSTTLRSALTADPAPLDPDTYYEAQALPITNGIYEGLVTYANNSPKIIPQLATKWTISPDGKTYTFSLRSGVQFSDGHPFDAAAAKASFERRTALEGGPSYMLAEVGSMDANGMTFVVHLKKPQAAFLDYLASPYSPKVTDPAAIAAHRTSSDPYAAKWLGSHSAGTGPYMLGAITRGTSYELTYNPKYWGSKPHFTTVIFNVVPNVATQRLEVESGQLDMIFDDINPRDLEAMESSSKVQVKYFPALFKTAVWVDPSSKVFSSPSVRAALRAGLDNETLTKEILGPSQTPSTEVYPPGMLPKGAAPDEPEYDPAKLKAALVPFKGENVTVGYYQNEGAMEALADHIQVQLQELGLNATTRPYPPAQLFGLPTNSSQRPDLMTASFNPDAVAPDTFARIYWYTEAPVNLLGCSVPNADALLDEAAVQPTSAAAVPLNVKAAEAYRASNCWLNIADDKDLVVARPGITGFEHELPWVLAVRLSALKEE
jgi:peptide/nickel transport system substrate-binding protein